MTDQTFRLPDVGEGLTEAEIVAWHVAVGDIVELNQTIVEIETAKAIVELPSPYAGVVATVHAGQGSVVEVGAPIITFRVGSEGPAESEATPSEDSTFRPGDGGPRSVLVGYGPTEHSSERRRPRRRPEPAAPPTGSPPSPAQSKARPLATPPIRAYARRRGVNLAEVITESPTHRVTRAAIDAHALGSPALRIEPNVEQKGREFSTLPLSAVRRATAAAMVRSAFTAPHATLGLTVDATGTTKLIADLKEDRRFAGVPVTPTLIAARALIVIAQRYPELNSRWADTAIHRSHRVNLGIAAATARGLLVPTVPDAGALSLLDLAQALADLTTAAREGRTTPASMTGGTVTLTNVGVFGVDFGVPILNPGESAILCLGAMRRTPQEHKGPREAAVDGPAHALVRPPGHRW